MLRRHRHLASSLATAATLLFVCLIAAKSVRGDGAAAKAGTSGTGGSTSGSVPYWQAPALPSAVIQGGAIPAGWQPQAVPYQGIGPDGRPMTMYVAPTYVFTYQAGPPVLATQPVNRRPPTGMPPSSPYGAYGWNYQTQGAATVPVTLPPSTVARYQPVPYQFPPDARALGGTPIVPPATALPGPPMPVSPQAPGFTTPPMPQQPLAAPPTQWVPVNPPPTDALPPQSAGWGAAAPALAATAVPLAAAAATTTSQPPPTASLTPPITTVPNGPASPVSIAAPPAAGPTKNTHLWKVIGVHDGDTVTCIDEFNQQQKIRLAEIDAPEVSQDFGKVSREALAGMVFGKTIQVVDDGKDRYGRWIGRLYVDGLDVNRQMVATGMAWHYAAYSKDSSLASLQAQARAQRLGLWSQPNPTPPWDYRKNGKKAAA